MIDIKDRSICPTLKELGDYIRNPVFTKFCSKLMETFQCKEKIEYSSCSWEPGWNIKFRKAGKNLCTIYPRESFFTVLLVVGKKEKESVEAILSDCTDTLQDIYRETQQSEGRPDRPSLNVTKHLCLKMSRNRLQMLHNRQMLRTDSLTAAARNTVSRLSESSAQPSVTVFIRRPLFFRSFAHFFIIQ